MKKLTLTLLAATLAVAMTPVCAQDAPPQLPRDGNGLLEYCDHVVNALDSPSPQLGPVGQGAAAGSIVYAHNMFKEGWCMAHLQTMRQITVFWQVQVAKTVAILSGTENPPAGKLNEIISKSPDMTCIPNEVPPAQFARVLVKWLRNHPERLHEFSSILTVDALHSAFPCQAPATTNKPATN